MIRKLLRRFGFVHEDELTEEFLAFRLAEFIGDPTEYSLSKTEDENFFRDLGKVDGASEWFRATAAKDMQRHFGATDQNQAWLVHGAFGRTMYIANRLAKSRGLRL